METEGCGTAAQVQKILRTSARESESVNGRRAGALLDVRTVDERAGDGVGNVGRGQDVLSADCEFELLQGRLWSGA